MENDVVVVVVPFVAQGHLNQLLHLSRILSAYNLPIHIVGTTTHNRQAKLRIHGWNHNSDDTNNIHFHELQTPIFESPPPNPNSTTKFPSHLLPSFKAAFNLREPFSKLFPCISRAARRVVVIHDYLMSSVVQDVASLENVEAYVFHAASVFTTFSFVWEEKGKPCLDDTESYKQLTKILNLQDLIPQDFIEFIFSHIIDCQKFNSGSIHDTNRLIEGKFINFLEKEGLCGRTEQWALGPFNPVSVNNNLENQRHSSLQWLDKQAEDSVIYVSFGSTTSLSNDQIQELAIGLENSSQKFIWVLRDADKGDIFEGDQVRNVELPKGFEERLKENGLVVREWAPQLEILAHSATGGFMSHCGWNSCMESITMGIPIAAWPMHSDQPRNAVLIMDVLNIGVSVVDWESHGEVVKSLNIEKTIRKLMDSDEGNEMRKRAKKLGEDVRKSVEEGGVTRKEIDSFVAHITR